MQKKKRAVEKLLDIVYPPRCMFCKKQISRYSEHKACDECIVALPYTKNGGCFETFASAAYLVSPLMYEDKVKIAIKDLKFKAKRENAYVLAQLMAGYLANVDEAKNADVIVNVPLSPKSLQRRGFNQTLLLAEHISASLGIPLDDTALVKVRETKRQSSLSTFGERAANVLGAYECASDMSGKTVILVDDIYTSGMTVYNCANALCKKGAAKVIAATAANAHKEIGASTHDYKASRLVFRREK